MNKSNNNLNKIKKLYLYFLIKFKIKNYKANIIINTYREKNQDNLIRSVKSCLNQVNCKTSVIISTVEGDESLSTLKDFNVTFAISKSPGIYSQLNNALRFIEEDWWCYFSGNDVMYKNKMYNEISCCLLNNALICYSSFESKDLRTNKTKQHNFLSHYDFNEHLKGNFVYDLATIHRSVIEQYGPFNEEFDNLGFWDFWLRIGRDHPEYFTYNKKPTFNYVVSNESRSQKRKKDQKWKEIEFNERKKMLSRFGELKGKYAKNFKG